MGKRDSEKINKFFYASLIFAFSFILANIKIEDPDAFIHIKLGEYIVKNFSIPSVDPFVYTYTENHYNNSAWLSQLIYYLLYKQASFSGLIIFNAILVGFTYSILFLLTDAMGAWNIPGFILILTISYASKERFVLRPHIFSLLFLSITIYLSFTGSERRRIFLYFLLFMLWANLHSGFIYGLTILGCFVCDSIIKLITKNDKAYFFKSIYNLSGAISGSLITPIPFAGYRFSTGLLKLKSSAEILEWRGLFESHYTFLLIVTIISILLFLYNWRNNSIKDWLIILIFTSAAFWAWRNAYELLVVSTPYGVMGLNKILERFKSTERLISDAMREIIPLFLVIIFLSTFMMNDFYSLIGHGANPHRYPAGAMDFVDKLNIEGNIFNSFNFGGALAFRFYPEKKIFIDGLSSGIATEFLSQYVEAVENGEKFEKLVEEYDIKIIIVESDRGYIKRGVFDPGRWKLVYWDDVSMVLLRSDVLPARIQSLEVGDPSDIIFEALRIPVESSDYFLKELRMSRNIADSFIVNLAIGLLLRRQGRIDESIDALENAYLRQPFSFICMFNLAESYKDAGYTDAAEWLFKRIVLLNGGITGLSQNPFKLPEADITRIKNEIKSMEVNY